MRKIASILVLTLLCSMHVFAQGKTVTGKVTDEKDGSPLAGVSVTVKGTNTGTTTDVDGNYKISVSADATLVFSFVGMKTTEVAVGNQTTINLIMEADVKIIGEVVVTV